MKTRSRVALAGLLLVLLGGLAWLILSNDRHEPVYAGKPLSHWLKALDYSNRGQSGVSVRDARRAIHLAGTNGIPLYLEMLQATDSKLKLQLMALASKQGWFKIHFTTASAMRQAAQQAVNLLGVRAQAAVPALIKLSQETPLLDTKVTIAQILANMGSAAKDALPLLQSMASSTNASLQSAARNAMENINRAARGFDWETSALLGLRDFDTRRQADSARRLYSDSLFGGPRYGSAVPVLLELLKAPRTNSYWISFALEKLDPDAAASVVVNRREPENRRTDHPAGSATSGDSFAPSDDKARLLAVGDWSEPVADRIHRLRGRLLSYESPSKGRSKSVGRDAVLFLELQEVTGAINFAPATIYFDAGDGFEPELRDAQGKPAQQDSPCESVRPAASWIIVPFDGSVRFPVHAFGIGASTNLGGTTIQVGTNAWQIPVGVTNDYFLSATLTPPRKHKSPLDYDVWGETLKLPPVRVPFRNP